MTSKQTKAQAISQCLLAITDYYEVPPERLLSEIPYKGSAVKNARNMLICHLRRSGMSFESIGRLVKRSVDCVRTGNHQAVIRMLPEEQALFDALPSIPSTLSLTQTQ